MRKCQARYKAQQEGEKFYFTGEPCGRGHIANRRVSNYQCVECKRLEEAREYKIKHKLLLTKKAKEVIANETPEKRALRLEKARVRAQKYRAESFNYEKLRANKLKHKEKRKTVIQRQTPKWVGPEELWLIRGAYKLAKLRTKLTGIKWHTDHYYPLQGKDVCGLHVPENIRVVPERVNAFKAARNPDAP